MEALVVDQDKLEWFAGAKALASLQLIRSVLIVPTSSSSSSSSSSAAAAAAPASPEIEAQLQQIWKSLEGLDPKFTTAAALEAANAAATTAVSSSTSSSTPKNSDDASQGGSHGIGAGGNAWAVWDALGELSRVALQVNALPLAEEAAKKTLQSRSASS